ncbi:Stk1 family PASTA domain-containing Ser/Thr kinase [Pseudogracilibacillus auburnensis]|uniref:Serine/threonine-protein kinase PrkC n=1 Tax=Pseudogracilibacillus auburnensis TaxID=1494959 RepID=A0A2V3W3N0_9BACI|nr:Stk1 family PASTA domain-containing Ser/Thr kinase [Pseudogracilibacillus auburnensis]PXW88560.1 serine/threonine-protein kinase [Pseudogracilibacillus auburnensis]
MLEGHLLSERYRIKRTIGGGGMANVYLARDIILDRDVAIKVLRLEFANDPEFIERFDREAQAATSLSHPNIVNIYDVGEEDHILYMVMEYIDGFTLKEYIMQNGPLPVEEALEVMKQLTDAIAHAHANGLIHRDIKPQNILMDRFGNVKVTDFGIAIALSATSLTQTNSILGSVHYLSPEQARGGMATKKSDIYSLGIVLYELLTGQLPFSGQSPISIALKHLQNETPSVRSLDASIPQSVENIVLQATAKDPFHRYSSVYGMEQALNVALEPNHINEAVYEPPQEEGEETKAIPIITDDRLHASDQEKTLIHHESEKTTGHKDKPKEKNGKEKPKKKKKKFRKWLLAAFIFTILLGIAFVMFLLSGNPKEVTIPDLAGYEYEEAVAELEKVNLKANKELIFSEEIEEGLVVKTDPAEGRKVKEKSTIDVYVSDGQEKVTFEDYVGKNFNQVKRILEDAGYEVIDYGKESDKPDGEIINQIQPAAGSKVVPNDTKVIFEVSGGPKTISLSNLSGLTLNEAKSYAEKNGLQLEVAEEHSDSVEEGVIIRQNPAANADVTIGSRVDIDVSLGPKASPPSSHNVTFTIPFQPVENDNGELQKEQTVQIYVEDVNNDISNVFHEEVINSNEEYTLTLVIAPGETAEYKVVRDGVVIIERSVPYKEGG